MEHCRETTNDKARPDAARSQLWLRGEPRLEELLRDPMLLLVLDRWNTSVDEIRRLADRVEHGQIH
ncbi:hypothetical protein EDC65_3412 [Stella humosa]|uniref:Uncharacterized protein n=2 Tax=Stella humosa TaxID=94 RepID=A0A3N1L3T5_9PROT|nr:hypothetical protein [Stella humosa]ROP84065.1 hypothetical protein EDC65_3412 [Stella humosa]BBK33576.1 hypothetical protein STHU_42100 [Stella humosa]